MMRCEHLEAAAQQGELFTLRLQPLARMQEQQRLT